MFGGILVLIVLGSLLTGAFSLLSSNYCREPGAGCNSRFCVGGLLGVFIFVSYLVCNATLSTLSEKAGGTKSDTNHRPGKTQSNLEEDSSDPYWQRWEALFRKDEDGRQGTRGVGKDAVFSDETDGVRFVLGTAQSQKQALFGNTDSTTWFFSAPISASKLACDG